MNGLEDFVTSRIPYSVPRPSLTQAGRQHDSVKGVPYEFSYNESPLFCSLFSSYNSDINLAI